MCKLLRCTVYLKSFKLLVPSREDKFISLHSTCKKSLEMSDSRNVKAEDSEHLAPATTGKRETLTSRAKRIIGRELEDNTEESPPAESSCE